MSILSWINSLWKQLIHKIKGIMIEPLTQTHKKHSYNTITYTHEYTQAHTYRHIHTKTSTPTQNTLKHTRANTCKTLKSPPTQNIQAKSHTQAF